MYSVDPMKTFVIVPVAVLVECNEHSSEYLAQTVGKVLGVLPIKSARLI